MICLIFRGNRRKKPGGGKKPSLGCIWSPAAKFAQRLGWWNWELFWQRGEESSGRELAEQKQDLGNVQSSQNPELSGYSENAASTVQAPFPECQSSACRRIQLEGKCRSSRREFSSHPAATTAQALLSEKLVLKRYRISSQIISSLVCSEAGALPDTGDLEMGPSFYRTGATGGQKGVYQFSFI